MVYARTITVHYVMANGDPIEIGGKDVEDYTLKLSPDEPINLKNSECLKEIEGYHFVKSKIDNSDTGEEIIGLMMDSQRSSVQYLTNEKKYEWINWYISGDTYEVFMIYEADSPGGSSTPSRPTQTPPEHQKYIKKKADGNLSLIHI